MDVARQAHAAYGRGAVASSQEHIGFGHSHQFHAAVHGAAEPIFIQCVLAFEQVKVEAQRGEDGTYAGVLHVGRGHALGAARQQQGAGVVVVVVGKNDGPWPVVAQSPAVHLIIADGVKNEVKKTPRPAFFCFQ